MNQMATFQPQLIEATDTKGTRAGAHTLSVGVCDRNGQPYLRVIIGNDLARDMGLAAGSRVVFGVSEDRQALVIAPGQGWKLTKQGALSVGVMVKAEKLQMGHLKPVPLDQQPAIRYDHQLIADITDLNEKGA